MMNLVTLDAIRIAERVLRGLVLKTPLVSVGTLTTRSGNPILLKAESLQATGSFKVRGATFKLSRLTADEQARGVIAYFTGNHAQAVARAARQLGVPVTVVMSPDVPERKVQATEQWGAAVVMAEPTSQARRDLAERLARERELTLIPPYDDADVITGQGTVGVEILEQTGEPPSAVCGERVRLPAASSSIADAIKVQTLGDLAYPLIRRYVDDVVTVSERQILEAVVVAGVEAHLVLEPAGALALAAGLVYADHSSPASQPVIALASGGNTTEDDLRHALTN